MSLAFPLALALLLVVPLLVALYLLALRRRRRNAFVYSDVSLLRAAGATRASRRRHLPFALLMLALSALALGAARPQARVDVPVSASAVVLALDVSGSMCATDVEPNRLTAAQAAVRKFVDSQADSTRIGLVIFSGSAQIAVAPTKDRDQLNSTIDTLTTGRGTMIGSAILKSVEAISQIDSSVQAPTGLPGPGTPAAPPRESYAPEIVILLTDGANTSGVQPSDAAQVAAAQGVRVYPIGFGTTQPTSLECTREQLGGNGFEGFGGPGGQPQTNRRSFLVVDEAALRDVAEVTGGQYFAADDADGLQKVLEDLPRQVEVQKQDVELTAALVAFGLLALLGAGLAATRWSTFPP